MGNFALIFGVKLRRAGGAPFLVAGAVPLLPIAYQPVRIGLGIVYQRFRRGLYLQQMMQRILNTRKNHISPAPIG
jgi:hypothetical protein